MEFSIDLVALVGFVVLTIIWGVRLETRFNIFERAYRERRREDTVAAATMWTKVDSLQTKMDTMLTTLSELKVLVEFIKGEKK